MDEYVNSTVFFADVFCKSSKAGTNPDVITTFHTGKPLHFCWSFSCTEDFFSPWPQLLWVLLPPGFKSLCPPYRKVYFTTKWSPSYFVILNHCGERHCRMKVIVVICIVRHPRDLISQCDSFRLIKQVAFGLWSCLTWNDKLYKVWSPTWHLPSHAEKQCTSEGLCYFSPYCVFSKDIVNMQSEYNWNCIIETHLQCCHLP